MSILGLGVKSPYFLWRQPANQVNTTELRDRRGHDHMVVGFTTTYAISPYHH
jgi:hypothetical protein